MRALLILIIALGAAAARADAVPGRILKVLPFLVDQQGRIAKSPSLFDRDAYQAYLRLHTNDVAALRYDVLWKAPKAPAESWKIAVELRGVGTNGTPKLVTLETNVVYGKGAFGQWTSIPLADDAFRNFGGVAAWRVRLWKGGQMFSEQQSFLW